MSKSDVLRHGTEYIFLFIVTLNGAQICVKSERRLKKCKVSVFFCFNRRRIFIVLGLCLITDQVLRKPSVSFSSEKPVSGAKQGGKCVDGVAFFVLSFFPDAVDGGSGFLWA